MSRYFVLLETQRGGLVPLRDPLRSEEDTTMPTFDTYQQAREAALDTVFGEAFGFRIFDLHQDEV